MNITSAHNLSADLLPERARRDDDDRHGTAFAQLMAGLTNALEAQRSPSRSEVSPLQERANEARRPEDRSPRETTGETGRETALETGRAGTPEASRRQDGPVAAEGRPHAKEQTTREQTGKTQAGQTQAEATPARPAEVTKNRPRGAAAPPSDPTAGRATHEAGVERHRAAVTTLTGSPSKAPGSAAPTHAKRVANEGQQRLSERVVSPTHAAAAAPGGTDEPSPRGARGNAAPRSERRPVAARTTDTEEGRDGPSSPALNGARSRAGRPGGPDASATPANRKTTFSARLAAANAEAATARSATRRAAAATSRAGQTTLAATAAPTAAASLAPATVARTPLSAALPQANPAWAQTLDRATLLAERGGGRADVSLRPTALGKVDLRVQLVEGQIRVTMVAERPEAAFLLRREAHQLADALAGRGFAGAEVDVRAGSSGGSSGGEPNSGGRPDREPAPAAGRDGEQAARPTTRRSQSQPHREHRGVLNVMA